MTVSLTRIWRHFSFVGFVFLCFSSSVFAQISSIPDSASQTGLGGANSIVGTVFGPSGRPVETRVQIRLASMTSSDRITTTNENGNFAFRGLPTGGYTISVTKEKDYEPVTHRVDVMQFRGSPAQTYTLNVRLVPKNTGETKAGVVNAEFAGVPQPALDLFNKAVESIKAGDRKLAVEQFKLAIAEHPKFMLAFNELGVQYIRLNDLQNADEAFRSALKIKPEAFDPQMNLGVVLFLQKKFTDAEPILRAAVKLKEQSAASHYYLGMTLANLGRFDEAEKELVSSVKLGGEEMKEAHRTLAIIYSVRKDNKRALAELETYVKLVSTAPDIEQLKQRIAQLKGQ